MRFAVTSTIETWPIAGTFVISRDARTEVTVVVAEVSDGTHSGRGECRPYARYDETAEEVAAAIAGVRLDAADSEALKALLPPGAARNALDCALWDLRAKRDGVPAWKSAGLDGLHPVTTAYTLSLGSPDSMADAARKAVDRPLLKVKLGGDGDPERIRAIRAAAPRHTLIVDANEAWSAANLAANLAACAEAGVALIEQPLPDDHDAALAGIDHSVPICADESVHVAADLDALAGKYDAVNVKLDKAGGLTEALDLARAARARGFKVMAGCMLTTSLSMAPAFLVAQDADWVDLDGPLLLARDRVPGLAYSGATVSPPEPALWG